MKKKKKNEIKEEIGMLTHLQYTACWSTEPSS